MPQTLSTTHERLRAVLERLRVLAGENADTEVLADLDAATRRLVETAFKLVVLGEYKRGKSTLINALLGGPVLPMAVVPLTSIVTEVEYGARPSARIEFLDAPPATVGPDELPAYVTEPANPRNQKGVRRAIVFSPSRLLREGVTIVDTPGIGSVFEHNTEVTYRFLAEADAVVFVLAADQPLSAEERQLLRSLSETTDRIVFAVNRVDVLSEPDAATSLRFIRETLAVLEERPPELVFPLSAREALEARVVGRPEPSTFAAFERALRSVLIARKTEILGERALSIARKAADVIALRIESQRQAARLAGDELDRAISRFQDALTGIRRQADQSALLLKHDVGAIHSVGLRQLSDETRDRMRASLWPRVEAALGGDGGPPLRRRVQELSVSIGQWVVEELRAYYRRTEGFVHHRLARALDDHMERVQTAASQVVELANHLLGMTATVPRATAPIREQPRFYFRDWDFAGGELVGHHLWLRLPRRWVLGRAARELSELLDRRIEQNLGAIHYDWVTRLDDAVRQFETSSRSQLEQVVAGISGAMDRARAQRTTLAESRDQEIELATQRLTELRRLRSDLAGHGSGGPDDETVAPPGGPDPHG